MHHKISNMEGKTPRQQSALRRIVNQVSYVLDQLAQKG